MNAKRRTLAVLAAVIAVLGLALWALNRSTAAEEAASSAAADGTIPLCSFSTADLSRITYTYNGQTLTLDDADGSWTLAEDSDYHLTRAPAIPWSQRFRPSMQSGSWTRRPGRTTALTRRS